MADIKQVALPDGVTYDLVDDSAAHIISLTTAQWETLTPEQKASGDYVITDATMVPLTASAIPYSNTSSGLTADDVQEAIDELAQGGGGGGTTNYNNLTNKPQINSVTLSGDKSSSDLNIVWQGTQAQYDALVLADTIDPNTVYYVTDGTTVACASNEVTYDHTVSGLSATDVKGALDELASEKMDNTDPTGTGSLSLNRKASTTVGTNSSTLGTNNTASGVDSFAEGNTTSATGARSHAEGYGCVASGPDSHAEGRSAQSSGELSHAQGLGIVAQRKSQFVFGEWNIADTGGSADPPESGRGNYVEIVGNGNGSSSKSNARTLDWNGNETLAGDLTIKGNKSIDTELLTKSTSTATFNTTDYVDTVTTNSIQKKNGMVQLDLTFRTKALNSVQNISWGTVPSGYRPSTLVSVVASLVPNYTTSTACKPLLISITDAGVIRTLNQGGYGDIGAVTTNTQVIIHAVYFV